MWRLSPKSAGGGKLSILLTTPDGNTREYLDNGDGWTILGLIWRAYCPQDKIDPLVAYWVWKNCKDYKDEG